MGSLLVAGQEFQHILRLLNTNVDGRTKIMYALTSIRGIGRRFANIICKKAEVDMRKRAGACMCVPHGILRLGACSEREQQNCRPLGWIITAPCQAVPTAA